MLSNEELVFAQRYPFTTAAKRAVAANQFSLEEIPENVMARARGIIDALSKGKRYSIPKTKNSEILLNELLAYPVVKVLLSTMGREELYRGFAKSVSKSTFENLTADGMDVVEEVASDLNVNYRLKESVEVPLPDFLRGSGSDEIIKLVNQDLDKGIVKLSTQRFIRYLSSLVRANVLSALPVDLQGVPDSLKTSSRRIGREVAASQKKYFESENLGKVNPAAFPPCFAELYNGLLAGKNLPHLARFDLVTFLVAVGMPAPQIAQMFKSTPNYDERTTLYQVERIAGKSAGTKYTPPSCSTIKAHTFCKDSCNVKHPLQQYRRLLKRKIS